MSNRYLRIATAEARRRLANLDPTAEDIAELALDILEEWKREQAYEAAENGYDDCPTAANCDDSGTGEGRFHGRI